MLSMQAGGMHHWLPTASRMGRVADRKRADINMTQDQQPRSISTFDYVVVGTGAAGSIVAARLSEDAGVTVCALESGPRDRHPYIHIPAGFIKIMFNEAYTWQFRTEPSPNVNGRSVIIPVGRTVGGSSSI